MRYRTVIASVLLAWIVVTAAWANRPWSDHVPLATEEGQPPPVVRFECGAPLGEGTVTRSHEPAPGEPAVSREPCAYRGERRFLAFLNIGLALGGLLLVGWLTLRSRPTSSIPGESLEVRND